MLTISRTESQSSAIFIDPQATAVAPRYTLLYTHLRYWRGIDHLSIKAAHSPTHLSSQQPYALGQCHYPHLQKRKQGTEFRVHFF